MKHDNQMTEIGSDGRFRDNRIVAVAKASEDQSRDATLPPRFDIIAAEIDCVVQIFYAAVRDHQVLGPIFSVHVTDWPMHEAKIAGFWKKTILHHPGYEGNPMQAHMLAGNVNPAHFRIWLDLFDETLSSVLSPTSATAWSALAHRIGRGLRIGVEDVRSNTGGIPSLR